MDLAELNRDLGSFPNYVIAFLVQPIFIFVYLPGILHKADEALADTLRFLFHTTVGIAKGLQAIISLGLLLPAVALDAIPAALPKPAAAAAGAPTPSAARTVAGKSTGGAKPRTISIRAGKATPAAASAATPGDTSKAAAPKKSAKASASGGGVGHARPRN
jgi:hypothetical protein